MHTLTVRLTNHPSPLEPAVIPGGFIEEELRVDMLDMEEIINKIEPMVEAIENHENTTIGVLVRKEDGGIVLHGTVQNGSFHGVGMS